MDGKGKPVPLKQSEDDFIEAEVEVVGSVDNDIPIIKGEVQPPAYRDWHFSVLFFAQVVAIAATALSLGPSFFQGVSKGISNTTESDLTSCEECEDGLSEYDRKEFNCCNEDVYPKDDDGYRRFLVRNSDGLRAADILFFAVGSFLAAALVVMGVFRIMIRHPLLVVKISFFTAPATFWFVGLVCFAAASNDNDDRTTILGFFWMVAAFFSAISLCYYYCFKRFMPFAAVNLRAALTAVRANIGLFFLSVGAIFVVYAWSILWVIAFAGVLYHDSQKEKVPCSHYYDDDNFDHSGMCDQQPNAVAITLLVLCFYWTQQVIQNTVHTTTAGAVGTWWFEPAGEDFTPNNRGCCGQNVSDSLHRTCTYSFGSVCFGSLLVAILQTLENAARNNRNRRDVVSLVIQCLIMCFRSWLEYFNSWAFCYVGIYGYSYVESGKKVIELFKARGWTTFLTDRLVFRVLLMANLGIAALTGALCVLLILFLGAFKIPKDAWVGAVLAAFWIGFLVGLLVSQTVLFVVESATRTIMVCFAEQPVVAEGGRPLVQELKNTYVATYPDIFNFRGHRENEMANRSERSIV